MILRIAIIFFLLLINKDITAQKKKSVEASFPGGIEAFENYINNNKRFKEIITGGYEGVINLMFYIDTNGKSFNEKITNGLCGICDSNALNVIRNMPLWTPSIYRGKKIVSKKFAQFNYILERDSSYYFKRGIIYEKKKDYLMAAHCYALSSFFETNTYNGLLKLASIAELTKDMELYCAVIKKIRNENDTLISKDFFEPCDSINDSITNNLIRNLYKGDLMGLDSIPYILLKDGKKKPAFIAINRRLVESLSSRLDDILESTYIDFKLMDFYITYIIDQNGSLGNMYVDYKYEKELSPKVKERIDKMLSIYLLKLNTKIYPATKANQNIPFSVRYRLNIK